MQKTVIDLVAQSGVTDDISKFDPTKTFKHNGIDSLDVMTVLLTVEEHYGMKFSDEEATALHTADDIVRMLQAKGFS